MGDLSKLKIGIGQVEVAEGRPSANEAACDKMIERALDCGADALVVPNSLVDESDVRIIGLNDSRIDVAGNVVVLDACGESYRIGIGAECPDCDFTVSADLTPYTLVDAPRASAAGHVVLRPVGMRERGKQVLAFGGASAVVSPTGKVIQQLPLDFQEHFELIDFSCTQPPERMQSPDLLDVLVSTMRRFDEQVLPFGPTWVIGLSGGLDSSVNAALLALAFGPERVAAYNMATRYNSLATKSNAAALAEALGVRFSCGSIEDMVVSLGNTLVGYGYAADALKGLALENAQARARGNLLSTFAALEGGVVVNNGNRVECALGYATLYGDAIGALSPVGDLTKVQLFDLAHQINDRLGAEVVPENLLPVVNEDGIRWETMPSAELSSAQVDPMKWFYHDWLVGRLSGDGLECAKPLYDAAADVVEHYLSTKLLDTEVARWIGFYGLDDPASFAADLQWVVTSIQRATFKRIQAPPRIALASRASIAAGAESQAPVEAPSRYNALMRRLVSYAR